MCKGYIWKVQYGCFDTSGKYDPIPEEWCDTLAEARKLIRTRGPMDRRPEEYGVIAQAVPVRDIPPNYVARGVDVHYFRSTSRGIREFV